MDPRLSPGCVAPSVLFFRALLLVKSVLSPVDLSVTKEFVLRSDCVGHRGALKELEKLAVGDDFALEYTVEPQTFLAAESDRLGP